MALAYRPLRSSNAFAPSNSGIVDGSMEAEINLIILFYLSTFSDLHND